MTLSCGKYVVIFLTLKLYYFLIYELLYYYNFEIYYTRTFLRRRITETEITEINLF